jgi:hypothetical protein
MQAPESVIAGEHTAMRLATLMPGTSLVRIIHEQRSRALREESSLARFIHERSD